MKYIIIIIAFAFSSIANGQVEKNKERILKTLTKAGYENVEIIDFGMQNIEYVNSINGMVYKIDQDSGYEYRGLATQNKKRWFVLFLHGNHIKTKRMVMLNKNKKRIIR